MPVSADEHNPVRRVPAAAARPSTAERIIVKFHRAVGPSAASTASTASATGAESAAGSAAALAARVGMTLRRARPLAARLQVLDVAAPISGESMDAQLARLRADPAVEYAELDARRYPLALPDDPLYPGQWYLQSTRVAPSAIDAEGAWDTSTGSTGVVVADVDTGVLYDHPDLLRASVGGRLLPGYDFISDPAAANDGDGRDPDAADPGDWVTSDEASSGQFQGCDVGPSSWHGTRVAGILGARTNNGAGIAGATWSTWILPVRALGKCGGFDSDILPAILWAAGLHVDGVPDNPYPAKIVNLSVGATGNCPAAYQDVIDELAARGVLVVVSAGNEGAPVDAPANCRGVASVGGLRHVGTKVGFSNLGPEVAISAPAGNCVNSVGACLYSLDTTYDVGTTTPAGAAYTDQLDINVGTSFAAPIVSGVTALMLSVNGNLDAAELLARLKEGAAAFPVSSDSSVPQCHVPTGPDDLQTSECSCTTDTCGAGMVNAPGALQAALRPIAAVAVPAVVSPGQEVQLSAAGSAAACGHTVVGYAWSVIDGGGTGAGVSSPDGATTSITAPASGTYTVRLGVTDDAGLEDTADVVIGSNSATSTAPAAAGTEACPTAIAPPAAEPITVSVTPAEATVQAGATATFAAVVSGTADTAVTWQINGIAGGNVIVGTISSDGVYTAPGAAPSPSTLTLTALSSADPRAVGSAQVTIVGSSRSGGGGGVGSFTLAVVAVLALVALRADTRRRLIAPHTRAGGSRVRRAPARNPAKPAEAAPQPQRE